MPFNLQRESLEDQARRHLRVYGWRGEQAMFGGGFFDLPQLLVEFARHISNERDLLIKIVQDLNSTTIQAPTVISIKCP